MEEILFIGYEATTVLIPFLVALIVSSICCKRKGIVLGARYYIPVAAFAVYVLGVFYVTGLGTLHDALYYAFDNTLNVNLIPFSQDIDFGDYALNVVMLVPFGILVPCIWKRLDSWPGVLLSSLGFILLIELSQLCNYRGTDVDDVIMNLVGAAIGYLIFLLAKKALGLKATPEPGTVVPAYQLPLFVGIMFLGQFLLFNPMRLAALLYGF